MIDYSYNANMTLVKAGFASIIHLAVLEGLKKQTWELEADKSIIKFYGEDLVVNRKRKIEPQISFAFEGGWDLDYPRTVEMRTYGGSGSLKLDIKYGEGNIISPTEDKFCKEVVRLWKLCEKALLSNDDPKISEEENNSVIATLKNRHNSLALKNRLDEWNEENYKNGAMIVIALARAVDVSPHTLARQVTLSFGNPFHKFPYVEVHK